LNPASYYSQSSVQLLREDDPQLQKNIPQVQSGQEDNNPIQTYLNTRGKEHIED
jgi:hypothetical protein